MYINTAINRKRFYRAKNDEWLSFTCVVFTGFTRPAHTCGPRVEKSNEHRRKHIRSVSNEYKHYSLVRQVCKNKNMLLFRIKFNSRSSGC